MRIIIRVLIFLLLAYVLNVHTLLVGILKISIPAEEILWLTPMFIIFLIKDRSVKDVRNFVYFLFLVLYVLGRELSFFGTKTVFDADYLVGFLKFYSIYLGFIYLIKKESLYFLHYFALLLTFFVSVLVVLMHTFGIFEVHEIEMAGRRNFGNLISINALSFIAALGVYLVLHGLKNYSFTFLPSSLFLILFMYVILLHQSRGALVIVIALFFLFLYMRKDGFIYRSTLVVISGLLLLFIFNILDGSLIFSRFETEIIRSKSSGRQQEVIAAWVNFTKEPLTGVGHLFAGFNRALHTYRCNVHFFQVLAAYGLFFFILFWRFIIGLASRKNKFNFLAWLIFFVIGFVSYNWTEVIPILVVLVSTQNSNELVYEKNINFR